MTEGRANETVTLVMRAKEAYERGLTDESRRLFKEALSRSPRSNEIRELIRRLFPDLLSELSEKADAASAAGWGGSQAIDCDWADTMMGAQSGTEEAGCPAAEGSAPVAWGGEASGAGGQRTASEQEEDCTRQESGGDDVGSAETVRPPAPGLELLRRSSERATPFGAPPSDAQAEVPGVEQSGQEAVTEPDPVDEEVEGLLEGARELFDLADFSSSLELVEKALALKPDHEGAKEYLERNRQTLTQMYESRLAPMDRAPTVMIARDEIVWLSLDHRAGFLLAQIDGTVTFEDLYAISGMSRLDTSRILCQLLDEGVIQAS